jgi:hypothetical protein
VFFKVSKWVLVFTLCVTLGFHWVLLQSVAWMGMVVSYSCEGSFKDAVSKTFDGKHPCPLCKLVREGKKNEQKPDSQLNVKKIDMFAEQSAPFQFPPRPALGIAFPSDTATRTEPPLLRPPRPFFG